MQRQLSWGLILIVSFSAAFSFVCAVTHDDVSASLGSRADVDLSDVQPGVLVMVDPDGSPATAEAVCSYEGTRDQVYEFGPVHKVYYNYLGEMIPVAPILNLVLPGGAKIETQIDITFREYGLRVNHQKTIRPECIQFAETAVQQQVLCVISKVITQLNVSDLTSTSLGAAQAAGTEPDQKVTDAGSDVIPNGERIYGLQFSRLAIGRADKRACPLYNDGNWIWLGLRNHLIKVRNA